jgi:hypothetical protein
MAFDKNGNLDFQGRLIQVEDPLEKFKLNTDKLAADFNKQYGSNVTVPSVTELSTNGLANNLYSGLVDGKQMTLGQEDIARFDPGKITSAQVDGQLYDSSKGGIGDWGHEEWGTAGNLGLGVGQLGLGLASYFENKKTADAQRKLLGQQYASNAEAITDRRANKAALANIKIK